MNGLLTSCMSFDVTWMGRATGVYRYLGSKPYHGLKAVTKPAFVMRPKIPHIA